MADPKLRLFFALWPDPQTRASLAALAQRVAVETGGRATTPDNVHLTLAFLGAQPRDSATELIARAGAIDASPFVLTLDHIDCWRKNAIAWLGASEIPPALASLREALLASLAPLHIADEARPFAVHVTLARKVTGLLRRRLARADRLAGRRIGAGRLGHGKRWSGLSRALQPAARSAALIATD